MLSTEKNLGYIGAVTLGEVLNTYTALKDVQMWSVYQ